MTDDKPKTRPDIPSKSRAVPSDEPIAPPPPSLPPKPEACDLEPKLPCKDERITPGMR
ncbi:hypothetical protein [Bosea sp. (in: a-proteobacteria)]|uniref:hypothetical protein n=1 Tax=Bosea sp. (in: a-proteobacteria) TaxID=1871050 RepID=UPI0025C66F31|nr:hypothetical protein [Bosea sp. (in: a-proteobacteria)]